MLKRLKRAIHLTSIGRLRDERHAAQALVQQRLVESALPLDDERIPFGPHELNDVRPVRHEPLRQVSIPVGAMGGPVFPCLQRSPAAGQHGGERIEHQRPGRSLHPSSRGMICCAGFKSGPPDRCQPDGLFLAGMGMAAVRMALPSGEFRRKAGMARVRLVMVPRLQ
jgi:hypothetical protein